MELTEQYVKAAIECREQVTIIETLSWRMRHRQYIATCGELRYVCDDRVGRPAWKYDAPTRLVRCKRIVEETAGPSPLLRVIEELAAENATTATVARPTQ